MATVTTIEDLTIDIEDYDDPLLYDDDPNPFFNRPRMPYLHVKEGTVELHMVRPANEEMMVQGPPSRRELSGTLIGLSPLVDARTLRDWVEENEDVLASGSEEEVREASTTVPELHPIEPEEAIKVLDNEMQRDRFLPDEPESVEALAEAVYQLNLECDFYCELDLIEKHIRRYRMEQDAEDTSPPVRHLQQ